MAALSDVEVRELLDAVPAWSVVDGRLHREWAFADFSEAFAFMTRVAMIAEKLNHHPDWSNSWNRVTIDVVSHDQGGLTEQCFEFARRVDSLG